MSENGYRREAERLAHESLDGDYGDEGYRLRLAAVAQVYATLHLAERLDEVADRVDALVGLVEQPPVGRAGDRR